MKLVNNYSIYISVTTLLLLIVAYFTYSLWMISEIGNAQFEVLKQMIQEDDYATDNISKMLIDGKISNKEYINLRHKYSHGRM
jgi:hypothetical protein